MPYFPVDDDMAFHPKVLSAGNDAVGMWARAGALCKKHTTGGFVSTETARALGTKKLADRLVSAGLWAAVDGGYQFHDWTAQAGNATAEEEKSRKDRLLAQNAQRQARWRDKQRERSEPHNEEINDVTNDASNPSVTTRPSPSPSPSPITDPTGLHESSPDLAACEMTDQEITLTDQSRLAALDIGVRNLAEVVEKLCDVTGEAITGEAALEVSRHLLSRAAKEPRHPGRYVLSAIEQSPTEVRNYLDWAGLAA